MYQYHDYHRVVMDEVVLFSGTEEECCNYVNGLQSDDDTDMVWSVRIE